MDRISALYLFGAQANQFLHHHKIQMLRCFSFKAASPSLSASPAAVNHDLRPSISPANSAENTPPSSSAATVNLSREFTLALQTRSYNEIWTRVHVQEHNGDQREPSLSEVLQPNRQCVEKVLGDPKPTTFTRLVSSYFDHSEKATSLCLNLYQSIRGVRDLYKPLFDLLEHIPHDPQDLTESHCNRALDIFVQFDSFDNPFRSSDSDNFQEMRRCLAQLKQQVDHRLQKSRSRVSLLRLATTGPAICLVGAVVGVAVSAAVIASHAFVTLVLASPLCSAYLPRNFKKREVGHICQLDAAAKGTFVLINHLATIDRLVARLHTAIEGDKLLIRLGLERGGDSYHVQEVVKQLRKNHLNFIHQLKDLEYHMCLCFINVNEARSMLLQEIDLHQSYTPKPTIIDFD